MPIQYVEFEVYFCGLWLSGNPLGENFHILYCSYIYVEYLEIEM